MENNSNTRAFRKFLLEELAISGDELAIALQHKQPGDPLAMLLWQYGLISLTQLQQIFDWLLYNPPQPAPSRCDRCSAEVCLRVPKFLCQMG
ncbi:MAG: DUF2949 domain-containing protein [Limnospira sp.]